MLVLLNIALQIGAVPSTGYDTKAVTRACDPAANATEIVVCGSRKTDRYRLKPLAPDDPRFGKAQTSIAGAKVGVETEQVSVGGIPSNRVMARIKIKF